MQGYIYLNSNDLAEEKRMELFEMACEEVSEELTQEEADELRMDFDDLVRERADRKLIEWSNSGKFVFNF